jgi:hypothetical protein
MDDYDSETEGSLHAVVCTPQKRSRSPKISATKRKELKRRKLKHSNTTEALAQISENSGQVTSESTNGCNAEANDRASTHSYDETILRNSADLERSKLRTAGQIALNEVSQTLEPVFRPNIKPFNAHRYKKQGRTFALYFSFGKCPMPRTKRKTQSHSALIKQ